MKKNSDIDVALAKACILPEVAGAVYDNGQVTVYVNCPVADCYDKVVECLRHYCPEVMGEVRRGNPPTTKMPEVQC